MARFGRLVPTAQADGKPRRPAAVRPRRRMAVPSHRRRCGGPVRARATAYRGRRGPTGVSTRAGEDCRYRPERRSPALRHGRLRGEGRGAPRPQDPLPAGARFGRTVCGAAAGGRFLGPLDGPNRCGVSVDPDATGGCGLRLRLDRRAPGCGPRPDDGSIRALRAATPGRTTETRRAPWAVPSIVVNAPPGSSRSGFIGAAGTAIGHRRAGRRRGPPCAAAGSRRRAGCAGGVCHRIPDLVSDDWIGSCALFGESAPDIIC